MASSIFLLTKQRAKRLLADSLYYSGLVKISRSFVKGQALILMYHRVLDASEVTPSIHPGMYVTSESFSRQLEYLSKTYHVVTLEEMEEWFLGKRKIDGTPCLITFDDGWEDNYRNAFPLLRKFSMPAAIFLVTEQIDREGMLTWSQVREMESAGISFGSHTETHAILKGKNEEEVRRELKGSKSRLQKELHHPSDWFCFPKGEYDETSYRLVKEFYKAALTTHRGAVRHGDDPHQIKRIGIHNDVSMTTPLFACRLLTF